MARVWSRLLRASKVSFGACAGANTGASRIVRTRSVLPFAVMVTAYRKARVLARIQKRAIKRLSFLLVADGSTQLRNNFLRCLDRRGVLVDIKRDGADARVAASAVALADAGEVHLGLLRCPWI